MSYLSESVTQLLACPMCSASLRPVAQPIRCTACGAEYPLTPDGRADLRLRGNKAYPVEFRLGGNLDAGVTEQFGAMPSNPNAQLDYRSIRIPPLLTTGNRLTRELLSYFPRPTRGGTMLDLGCGFEAFKEISSHTGLEYVGVDYDGGAMLLADAHALPFKADAFDFIISFAVLEHLRYPAVAIREALRVLKPGGTFIGTVAFLEPFHMNSYYHPSPLGTYDLLSGSGFEVRHLEPNANWQALGAQSQMSLFPHAPPALAQMLALPVQLLSRLWWKVGYALTRQRSASEHTRRLTNAAGFRWVCTKPATSRGAFANCQRVSSIDEIAASSPISDVVARPRGSRIGLPARVR
jgi:SAM-dependent methyltransferase